MICFQTVCVDQIGSFDMKLSEIYSNSVRQKQCSIIDVTSCKDFQNYQNADLSSISVVDILLDQISKKIFECLTTSEKFIVACAFKNSLSGLLVFLMCAKNNLVYYPVDNAIEISTLENSLKPLRAKFYLCGKLLPESSNFCHLVGTVIGGEIFIYRLNFELNKTILLPEIEVKPDWLNDLAYVISTSGTTGLRKHVLVSNQSIISNVNCVVDRLALKSDEVIAQNTSYLFDPFFVEAISWLITGSTLLIFPLEFKLNFEKFHNLITTHNVTFLQTTPSSLAILGAENIGKMLLHNKSSLRNLALGG